MNQSAHLIARIRSVGLAISLAETIWPKPKLKTIESAWSSRLCVDEKTTKNVLTKKKVHTFVDQEKKIHTSEIQFLYIQ